MTRYNIHGQRLTGTVFTTKCCECGMPTLDASEFHPWEACKEFKLSHDSTQVEKILEPLYRERILKIAA